MHFRRLGPIIARDAFPEPCPSLPKTYDVVVIGGALAGAATATLLLRKNPGIRVLIVEKSEKLTRRVGEATVEVSGYFLGRVLGMTQYLNEHHISKQGLRFWFTNDEVKSLDQAAEIGPRYLARLPSYQLDRAALRRGSPAPGRRGGSDGPAPGDRGQGANSRPAASRSWRSNRANGNFRSKPAGSLTHPV